MQLLTTEATPTNMGIYFSWIRNLWYNHNKRAQYKPVSTFYWICCTSTQWGLVMPYSVGDLCQHWFRQRLVAWRHQAITWTNVDWSLVKYSDLNIRALSQEMPQQSVIKIHLKITYLKFHSNFPGANELTHRGRKTRICVSKIGHHRFTERFTIYSGPSQ